MGVSLSRSSSERHAVLSCRTAYAPDEIARHAEIRHAVFVVEQGLFEHTDQDAFDHDPTVRHVLGYVGDLAVGTVRFYRLPSPTAVPGGRPGERLWKGDRLAVLPGYRHLGLGAPLVRYAVANAAAAGGDRMIAYVQLTNVVFFRWLGWSPVGDPAPYVGVPHQMMSIDLR